MPSEAEVSPEAQKKTAKNSITRHLDRDLRERLEEYYSCNPYPSQYEYSVVCEDCSIEQEPTRSWFRNRRRKAARNDEKYLSSGAVEKIRAFILATASPTDEQLTAVAKEIDIDPKVVRDFWKLYYSKTKQRVDYLTPSYHEPIDTSKKSSLAFYLEPIFQQSKYHSTQDYTRLAHKLGVDRKKIILWFTNRRNQLRQKGAEIISPVVCSAPACDLEKLEESCEKVYAETVYPPVPVMEQIASENNVTLRRIKRWFSKRRDRDRSNGIEIKPLLVKYTPEAIQTLHDYYEQTPFPSPEQLKELAEHLKRSEKVEYIHSVLHWFYKRRAEDRDRGIDVYQHPSNPHPKIVPEKRQLTEKSTKPRNKKATRLARFPDHVVEAMSKLYEECHGYPTSIQRRELAEQLGIDYLKINAWFRERQSRVGEYNDPLHMAVEEMHKKVKYPSREMIQGLADQYNETFKNIERWFKELRRRDRKSELENRRDGFLLFGPEVVAELEKVYELTPYPNHQQIIELANRMDLTLHALRGWFNNRRLSGMTENSVAIDLSQTATSLPRSILFLALNRRIQDLENELLERQQNLIKQESVGPALDYVPF
ncbi:hypothetical protein K493DRAFT_303721 [Basidiobolus meristosporus CBS 931.73]|uniref:Homeobox domain-containing protein n=1 Tax=Basidiobolus meristosporus CBS 931.73 TaxID=1314790 RepID=A0A1Y1Y1K5_9FUNG|nr:hypothetical protein K493DRAFT_303721 [Basidiobolus meristosporus CBS 931.73]|eukprot:ORX91890.1 hypothetical protein K493DRAFT_303721 [Basidiobolus meristosporus CBS 931.73]